jgi:DNA replication ATP-dependent helicase Dna2
MNEDIMHLSNRLIYENRLRCGSEQVARQALILRDRKTCADMGASTCGPACWVQDMLGER